jgi:hypothetical protein
VYSLSLCDQRSPQEGQLRTPRRRLGIGIWDATFTVDGSFHNSGSHGQSVAVKKTSFVNTGLDIDDGDSLISVE